MNTEEFNDGVHIDTYRGGVNAVLESLAPAEGKRPLPGMADLSAWFGGLSEEDKGKVKAVVRMSVYQGIFGMMCVLDGVSTIDDSHTELYLRTGDGTLLNAAGDLHDIFARKVVREMGTLDWAAPQDPGN